jgi:RluA family pseudouridine synthase
MHEERCLCEHIPQLDLRTRLALVMHHREARKTTATGPLALAALANSELHIHGRRDAPLDLHHLHGGGGEERRVLVLFPSETARPLSRALLDEDPRPITLVVPDGSWRQASRIPKRVPGLELAERVTLPAGPSSRWGIRRETKAAGLATLEAIARAFGILEAPTVQCQLEELFSRMVEATFAGRGTPSVAEPLTRAEDLSIVHQDDALVAINKPSGMLVHRGWARDGVPALQRLRDQLGRYVYPVHRLDRATSGVLLFALSSEVARDMQQLFETHAVDKRYLAMCRGHDATLRQVDHPLAKDKGADKRPAITDFRLLGEFERYGLYEARPRSGRTHQIRRHLKHVSQPIIGDVRYGKGPHNRIFRERFGFHRLALHCQSMCFEHPRGAGRVAIEAPVTKDFSELLAQLELAQLVRRSTP